MSDTPPLLWHGGDATRAVRSPRHLRGQIGRLPADTAAVVEGGHRSVWLARRARRFDVELLERDEVVERHRPVDVRGVSALVLAWLDDEQTEPPRQEPVRVLGPETLTRMIRLTRREGGLTTHELADLASVPPSWLAALEGEETAPDLARLLQVLDTLGLSLRICDDEG